MKRSLFFAAALVVLLATVSCAASTTAGKAAVITGPAGNVLRSSQQPTTATQSKPLFECLTAEEMSALSGHQMDETATNTHSACAYSLASDPDGLQMSVYHPLQWAGGIPESLDPVREDLEGFGTASAVLMPAPSEWSTGSFMVERYGDYRTCAAFTEARDGQLIQVIVGDNTGRYTQELCPLALKATNLILKR